MPEVFGISVIRPLSFSHRLCPSCHYLFKPDRKCNGSQESKRGRCKNDAWDWCFTGSGLRFRKKTQKDKEREERIKELAKPKPDWHPWWDNRVKLPESGNQTPPRTKRTMPSNRILEMAMPKKSRQQCVYDSGDCYGSKGRSKSATNSRVTPSESFDRICQGSATSYSYGQNMYGAARNNWQSPAGSQKNIKSQTWVPYGSNTGYTYNYYTGSSTSKQDQKSGCSQYCPSIKDQNRQQYGEALSERMAKLAKPKKLENILTARSWGVSEAAKNALCSGRIHELSAPLKRYQIEPRFQKTRDKKKD